MQARRDPTSTRHSEIDSWRDISSRCELPYSSLRRLCVLSLPTLKKIWIRDNHHNTRFRNGIRAPLLCSPAIRHFHPLPPRRQRSSHRSRQPPTRRRHTTIAPTKSTTPSSSVARPTRTSSPSRAHTSPRRTRPRLATRGIQARRPCPRRRRRWAGRCLLPTRRPSRVTAQDRIRCHTLSRPRGPSASPRPSPTVASFLRSAR